jgi:hypothetical protein
LQIDFNNNNDKNTIDYQIDKHKGGNYGIRS